MGISKTITEFRQDVLKRGGPQIPGMYEVYLQSPNGLLVCYPKDIVLPGRQFQYYEHDMWGPVRKVPYKRGYTQCHMKFYVYQDWAERTFIEKWMDTVIKNNNTSGGGSINELSTNTDISTGADLDKNSWGSFASELAQNIVNNVYNSSPLNITSSIGQALIGANAQIANAISGAPDGSFDTASYKDFSQYSSSVGAILIRCLNAQDKSRANVEITLKEVFPATISQMGLQAEGAGTIPTLDVTFQFNDYLYKGI